MQLNGLMHMVEFMVVVWEWRFMSNLNFFKKVLILCVVVNISFEDRCGASRASEMGRQLATEQMEIIKKRAIAI